MELKNRGGQSGIKQQTETKGQTERMLFDITFEFQIVNT